ncbi:glycosyltransferase family 2 protein [Orenia marismortui]|uniref:glycosyltransferase family 2 protein n=1 Tax=Orenia marismortui TaxID=46469 RepID=UPI00037220F7|nr:glycosyltransferase family 2 protein [Orenia marismortui]
MNKTVSAIIPAYNEEDSIEATIKTVKSIDKVKEVIVIDDGSEDETYQKAIKVAHKVIRLDVNQGKGSALNYGLKEAKGDILLLLDGDLAESASEAEKLIEPLLADRADMSIAQFPPSQIKGGFGLVKALANWGLKKMTYQEFSAPLSGQRALSKDVIKKIDSFAEGFGVEVALTIDVCKAGFKVEEVPVNMNHRETKRDIKGFLHRGKQFKDVLRVILLKMRR